MAAVSDMRSTLARALVQPGVFDAAHPPDAALLALAEDEGVLGLLEWRLQQQPDFAAFPHDTRVALASRSRTFAVAALLRHQTLLRLGEALRGAGLRALLLKGPAFARWLYPQPHLRVSGDFDLLLATRGDADRAARAFEPLGYALAFVPGSMTYEMTCRAVEPGVARPELDLHCRLSNVPAFADKFAFDALWEASIALRGLGEGLRGLGPVHALVHACMHRAVDRYLHRPDRLKWIHDIHLMVACMDDAAWTRVVDVARAAGLCGVCLQSLDAAIACFGTAVPAGRHVQLRDIAQGETLDPARLDDWNYMQWQSLRALPGWRARAAWLRQRLLPTRSQLQEAHGAGSPARLVLRRLARAWSRVTGAG